MPLRTVLGVSLVLSIAGGAMAVETGSPAARGIQADAPKAKASVPVTLTDVTNSIDATKTNVPEAARLLRQDMETEIAGLDWSKAKTARHYKLAASIVQLESSVSGKVLRASCAVSVAIREAKGGALLTSVVARARVEDAPSASARAERVALAAAARKAVTATVEAIRRAP